MRRHFFVKNPCNNHRKINTFFISAFENNKISGKTQRKLKCKIAVNPEPSGDCNSFYTEQIVLQRPI